LISSFLYSGHTSRIKVTLSFYKRFETATFPDVAVSLINKWLIWIHTPMLVILRRDNL
jgi:hypothetical protein